MRDYKLDFFLLLTLLPLLPLDTMMAASSSRDHIRIDSLVAESDGILPSFSDKTWGLF